MYAFREDFRVHDERSRSYQIEVEENTALSCGHARINDEGRYHVTLNGNRHFLKTPRLRNFRLELQFALTVYKMEFGVGFLIYFRYDRLLGMGQVLRVWWDPENRLHLFLNDNLLYQAKETGLPNLTDLTAVLELNENTLMFSLLGQQQEFPCPDLPGKPGEGQIAFDTDYCPGGTMLMSEVCLQAPETPTKTRIGQPLLFPLKKVQGFSETLLYQVDFFRYDSGETELECTLSGGIQQRGSRLQSGGKEWGYEVNFLFSPYLRIETEDPEHREFYNFYFANGEIRLHDPEAKPIFGYQTEWPLKKTLIFPHFPEKFTLAAGYQRAFMRPWCYAEHGPYEQIRDQDNEFLYEGSSLRGSAAVIQAYSPVDKKLVSLIPRDIPEYSRALRHAREQHYFFTSEQVVFELELFYHQAAYEAQEFQLEPTFTDVYGGALPKGTLDFIATGKRNSPGGFVARTYRIQLHENPGNGVYHLQIQWVAGCIKQPPTIVIFEVLSEDPEALCPPLASRLPVMISMPNELKYIESDAFDPYSEVGGFAHYYSAATRYAVPALAVELWKLLSLYRRKWMLMLTERNSGDRDIDSPRNAELLKKADYVDCHDLYYSGRYDLFNKGFYKKAQLGLLREFVATSPDPFKVLDVKKIEEIEDAGLSFPDELYNDLVETAWQPWCDFFAARIEVAVQAYVDRILAHNPRLARASYGPVPIYTSHYKSAYTLKYSGYPIEKDLRVRENGSFWFLEEYHYSCDYPLTRAAYFVSSYDLYYDYGRRIYPEIYYSGHTGCNDGAVFQAHPPFGIYTVPPEHQRRIVYQFTYGSPCFKNATFQYWTDYGFHVRTPDPGSMKEFVYAWGKLIHNEPDTPLKAPFLITDFEQFNRHGDYQETEYSFNVRDQYILKDVCNTAEEALGWSYELLCTLGYNTPVLSKLEELDAIGIEQAEFLVLPPIVKSTPAEFIAAIRRAHQRGLNLLCFEEVFGLEDLFGVQERAAGEVPVRELPDEVFSHRKALAKYENTDAEVLLWGAAEPGGKRNIPVALLKNTPYGRTAFFNLPPTTVKRESFRQKYSHGQDTLSQQIKRTARKLYRELSGGPDVWAERGAISACKAGNGAIIVTLSEDSPIYGDTTSYPVSFRFQIRAAGIGRRRIFSDAPYSVVSCELDYLVIRTTTGKDTALFFKFTEQ